MYFKPPSIPVTKNSIRSRYLALIITVLVAGAAQFSFSQESTGYLHLSKNQPIADVLRSFASDQGMPIIISPRLNGTVTGRFTARTGNEFLTKLSKIYNILWYYDGNTLYVYSSEESINRTIQLNYANASQVRESLERLGAYEARYNWRSLSGGRIIYVSGPPRFVEMVEKMAKVVDDSNNRQAKTYASVEIFPLKYALAYDRAYDFRGSQTVIPGVATLLREILGQGNHQGIQTSTYNNNRQGMPSWNRSRQQQDQQPPPGYGYPPPSQNYGSQRQVRAESESQAFIGADRRLNAVVIRARKENMATYAALIEKLDVPARQVEISVSILDVSTSHISELGVDWSADGGGSSASFGNVDSTLSNGGSGSRPLISPTIITADIGNFLGRIHSMSQDGNARVLSRPSVLTLDRLEAVLDNSSTFHVRVAGKDAVDLFPVTVGTMMRVTPRIVDNSNIAKIHLDINIEDGMQESGETVDNIPKIKKSTITTQATVTANASLLVGGYYYKAESDGSASVPILGDLPIVGGLFSSRHDEATQTVRLFLITPRIVSTSQLESGSYSPLERNLKQLSDVEEQIQDIHARNMIQNNSQDKSKADKGRKSRSNNKRRLRPMFGS